MTLGNADAGMRSQLRRIAEQVRNGVNPWDALVALRWITPTEAEALIRAEAVGNLPWVLETLAEAEEERWEHRLNYVIQLLQPALIILIGLAVAFIVIGFFMPMVKLVGDLS
jgi:type IV pilus assembly protein PilC